MWKGWRCLSGGSAGISGWDCKIAQDSDLQMTHIDAA